jgi:acyl-CoA thioester hydrolase
MGEEPMNIEAELYVRAYDVDAMGYVSNIVYVRWFEDLRHYFLDRFYPFADMIADSLSPVLTHTEVRYLLPLTISDRPVGRCRLLKAGGSRWTMGYEIACNGVNHCTGIQTGYFMNLNSRRPVRMPQRMIAAVSPGEGPDLSGPGSKAML